MAATSQLSYNVQNVLLGATDRSTILRIFETPVISHGCDIGIDRCSLSARLFEFLNHLLLFAEGNVGCVIRLVIDNRLPVVITIMHIYHFGKVDCT
jgi:hypothetical protein